MGEREKFRKKEEVRFGDVIMEKRGPGSYHGTKEGVEVGLSVSKKGHHLEIQTGEGIVQLHVAGRGRMLTGYIGNDKLLDYLSNLQSTVEQIRSFEGRNLPDTMGPLAIGKGTILK